MAEIDWKKYRRDIDLYCKVYPEDNLSKGHLAIAALVEGMTYMVDIYAHHQLDCSGMLPEDCDCGLADLIAGAKEILGG